MNTIEFEVGQLVCGIIVGISGAVLAVGSLFRCLNKSKFFALNFLGIVLGCAGWMFGAVVIAHYAPHP